MRNRFARLGLLAFACTLVGFGVAVLVFRAGQAETAPAPGQKNEDIPLYIPAPIPGELRHLPTEPREDFQHLPVILDESSSGLEIVEEGQSAGQESTAASESETDTDHSAAAPSASAAPTDG